LCQLATRNSKVWPVRVQRHDRIGVGLGQLAPHDQQGAPVGRRQTPQLPDQVQAPVGTLVFVRADVKRTAFADEPGTTIIALGGTPGRLTSPVVLRSGRRSVLSTRQASTPRPPTEAVS
jgi:hypothetical protein